MITRRRSLRDAAHIVVGCLAALTLVGCSNRPPSESGSIDGGGIGSRGKASQDAREAQSPPGETTGSGGAIGDTKPSKNPVESGRESLSRPPRLFLRSAGQRVEAQLDRFCWGGDADDRECDAPLEFVEPDVRLVVSVGATISVDATTPPRRFGGLLYESAKYDAPPTELHVGGTDPGTFSVRFSKGRYFLKVAGEWAEGGALYVVEFVVR